MATTQEFYRLGSRLPRYTTKLSAFANGMYLTNQTIPEGYARVMCNYDIDDTGSHIKPRRGRVLHQCVSFSSAKLGPVASMDYLYCYNDTLRDVLGTKDVVLSYGKYTNPADLVGENNSTDAQPVYVALLTETVDDRVWAEDEGGNLAPVGGGSPVSTDVSESWGLAWNDETKTFDKVLNNVVGTFAARTINNAYAFNKLFKNPVGRPVSTILENELITFTGPKATHYIYNQNSELDNVVNMSANTLSKVQLFKDTRGAYRITSSYLIPKVLNPMEAASYGYNILSSNPYTFQDTIGASLAITGVIMYSDAACTKPVFNPAVGTDYFLRVYYQHPGNGTNIKYKVEYFDLTDSSTDADWIQLSDFGNAVTSPSSLIINYNPKEALTRVRITVRVGDNTATEYSYITPTYDCTKTSLVEPSTYRLNTCKGMVSWQSCVGVYGIKDATNMLFFSQVGDPSYFPFPAHALKFDNEILAVHNYLDNLIVVTVDSIWLLQPGAGIINTVQKKILNNIHISEIDAVNLVVLKDQIFFKTDTQFYVLKPNQYTSDATDLKNYTNSTAIANYTNNFQTATVDLLNSVYKTICHTLSQRSRAKITFEDFDVLDTHSVIKDESVHYIYTIEPKLTGGVSLGIIALHFVYNTLTRSWRIYLSPIGEQNNYNPQWYRNKQSGSTYEFFIQDPNNVVITESTYNTLDDNIKLGDWNLTEYYNNFPYIDTGNVALDDTFTKRFREVQFNIMNLENKSLNFSTDFKVDGVETISATKYEVEHIVDEQDPDFGKLFVTPVETVNVEVPGTTTFGTDEDFWTLDMSKFPKLSVATVRLNLQGRGRRGSLQLLNTSLERYELSDVTWVYRTMSAR